MGEASRDFLFELFRAEAFPGTTPDRALFVQCRRDTMTQDVIDDRRLIIQIGVAPVRPAEFNVFRIEHLLEACSPTSPGG